MLNKKVIPSIVWMLSISSVSIIFQVLFLPKIEVSSYLAYWVIFILIGIAIGLVAILPLFISIKDKKIKFILPLFILVTCFLMLKSHGLKVIPIGTPSPPFAEKELYRFSNQGEFSFPDDHIISWFTRNPKDIVENSKQTAAFYNEYSIKKGWGKLIVGDNPYNFSGNCYDYLIVAGEEYLQQVKLGKNNGDLFYASCYSSLPLDFYKKFRVTFYAGAIKIPL